MAAHLGDHFFVGPDNGLFSVLYRRAEASGENINLVHLDREKYWLPRVSGSFHGRDIFAPVAAHMAAGIPLSELGSSLSDPVIIDLEEPQKIAGGWMGKVTWIDTFGNLATNVPAELIKTNPFINTTILGRTVQGLVRTFGECAEGELAALINSSGYLEIAEVNGSAARRLGAIIGDDVEILTGGSQSGG
jgi:hypothetical protein